MLLAFPSPGHQPVIREGCGEQICAPAWLIARREKTRINPPRRNGLNLTRSLTFGFVRFLPTFCPSAVSSCSPNRRHNWPRRKGWRSRTMVVAWSSLQLVEPQPEAPPRISARPLPKAHWSERAIALQGVSPSQETWVEKFPTMMRRPSFCRSWPDTSTSAGWLHVTVPLIMALPVFETNDPVASRLRVTWNGGPRLRTEKTRSPPKNGELTMK